MKSQENLSRRARPTGFTLLEMLIVLAIVGIVTGLSVAAFNAVGRRGALQNVAFDVQGVLNTARSRAMSRGFPVWVVFYPQAARATGTTGQGAFVLVDDGRSRFVINRPLVFGLPLKVQSPDVVQEQGGVTAVYFLEDYSKRVSFKALTPGATGKYGQPFAQLSVQACGFCSGTTPRGALVFSPDGSARFVDGAGNYLSAPNQAMAFSSLDVNHQYLFAISGPSGYVASFSP